MTKEGISFRTEVALATLQESDPQNSRKLLALINGYTDGDVFKEHSNALLLVILNKIIHEAENINTFNMMMTKERKRSELCITT